MSTSAASLSQVEISPALAAAEQRIRELTQALAQAREAEELVSSLNRLRDENPNPIVRLGANLQQQFANAAARRLGHSMSRADQVRVQRRLRTGVQAALQQQAEQREEVVVGDRIFDVCIVPFAQGTYANLYFSDVTEREAARQQLREHQQFMEQVLDTIPTVVLVRDTQQRLVFGNQAMRTAWPRQTKDCP